MTIGEVIQSQRKKVGLSQEKVAELVGTSRQAVTKWETDKSVPCMENMISLAKIFGISLAELSTGEGEGANSKNIVAVKKSKPLKPLLNNLSILGYVLFAAASTGYYEYVLTGRGVPFGVWLTMALLGGICILVRNIKYHEQYGKVPPLIFDFAFVVAVVFLPNIPLPHGYAIRIMQAGAIAYVPLYIFKLCPWRKRKEM